MSDDTRVQRAPWYRTVSPPIQLEDCAHSTVVVWVKIQRWMWMYGDPQGTLSIHGRRMTRREICRHLRVSRADLALARREFDRLSMMQDRTLTGAVCDPEMLASARQSRARRRQSSKAGRASGRARAPILHRTPQAPDPQGFRRWYDGYPLKRDRAKAERVWTRLTPEERTRALDALQAQVRADHFRLPSGQTAIPYPATWLSHRRWEDEVDSSDVQATERARGLFE